MFLVNITNSKINFNLNRNSLVNAAIVSSGTSFNGVNYKPTAQNITGLIAPGSDGVNHGACCFLCFIYLTDILCIIMIRNRSRWNCHFVDCYDSVNNGKD